MYVFTPLSTSTDYRVKKKLLMNRVVESVSEGFFFFFLNVFSEASTLRLIRNIKIIHLVNEDDLMPTALLDRHWEKLLKQECDDW